MGFGMLTKGRMSMHPEAIKQYGSIEEDLKRAKELELTS